MRITMDELKQAIKEMKTNNKGVDPYGLHPKLLKKKFVKTDYSSPSSWRPISLTSHLGKVVERVKDRKLRSSDILDIDEQQFGFQPGKSTLHYLYKLYHDILAIKNLPLATVYSLEKTFDSSYQTLLLSKLINSGLNGPMLATTKSFLSNRKVSIQVDDFIDMSFVPLNGLPQGAVLSPLLFIFYMKGFLQDANLTYKYADDGTSLSSKENLSTSLEKAENYKNKWRQVLNKDKTEHLNFSN